MGHDESTCSTLLNAAAAREEALRARVRELEAAAPRKPFDVRCADALADEVAALVRRKVIDSRSPAADALLDYRNPPSSPRADRMAELERELGELRKAVARPLIPDGEPERRAARRKALR